MPPSAPRDLSGDGKRLEERIAERLAERQYVLGAGDTGSRSHPWSSLSPEERERCIAMQRPFAKKLADLASRLSPENRGFCDQCEQHKHEVANLLEGESLCAPCLLVRVTALLEPAEGHDFKLADQCPTCGSSVPDSPENSSGVEEGFTVWERGAIHDFARRSLDALSLPEASSEVGQRWLALLNKTRDQREAADAR